ncbi:MAG: AAA family ATPase [bacterium]|nr:AAA family ATPase [bacterium]
MFNGLTKLMEGSENNMDIASQLKLVLPPISNILKMELKSKNENELGNIPCPFCGGNDRFRYIKNTQRWFCRGCNKKGGDVIDFHCKLNGLNFKELAAKHDININTNDNKLEIFNYLSKKRLIPEQILQNFIQKNAVFYIPRFGKNRTKAIGFNYSDLDGNRYMQQYIPLNGDSKQFKKGSKPSENGFFIAGDIKNCKAIILVESVINAMSGFSADQEYCWIALGSTIFCKKTKLLSDIKKNFICCFDNDKAGRTAIENINSTLQGCKTVNWDGFGNKEDINSLLQKGKLNQIKELVKRTIPIVITNLEFKSTDFKISHIREVLKQNLSPKWLVKNIIDRNSIVLVFGESGSKKTFWVIDLCISIATGKNFHGNIVKESGPVLYIAGEGREGIGKRFLACAIERNIDLDKYPLYISDQPAQILIPENVESIIKAIETTGHLPVLIVFDTLNRNFGPGNESDTKDMTNFISKIDRLRIKYHSSIGLVHHSGHQEKGRARGSSVLNAAVDWEYLITAKKDKVLVKCTKSKDFEPIETLHLKTKAINTGLVDEDGSFLSSLALISDSSKEQEDISFNKNDRIGIEALKEASKKVYPNNKVHDSKWREIFYKKLSVMVDSKREIYRRMKNSLCNKGIIFEDNYYYSFNK